MKQLKVKITGVAPLLLHNGRLKNPIDPIVKAMKEITAKRKKTDDDFMRLSALEFEGSIYSDKDGKVIIPDVNVEACIVKGAQSERLGKVAKAALTVMDHLYLQNGKQYMKDEMISNYEKYAFINDAKVGQASIMRTRPRIDDWHGEITVIYDESMLNENQVIRAIDSAGRAHGLGDWRPRFGRFTAEVL